MNTVLQLSDFALKVSFIDIRGKSLKIKKFKFSYSTQLSTPIVAEFDGVNYSKNCRPEADGVVVIFENPRFNVGQLTVHRTYSVEDLLFDNGAREITQVDILPINIAQSYPTNPQIPAPIVITADTSDIVFNETVRAEGIKGDNGADGKDGGIDYSLLTEQIVPDEYWIGTDGKRRQVYTRTYQGANSPISFPKGTFDKYGHAWAFYQIGKINNCRLLYANVGEHDVNDTVTGEPNYIHRGLELWFKESVNTKFNNVPYVLTFKYTKP